MSIPLFRPAPPDPLAASATLQAALDRAIRAAEQAARLRPGAFPVRITVVDVTDPRGALPSAGYLETDTDYIASEAKVAVMYAAYALRDMVRRFVAGKGAFAGDPFAHLARDMNRAIAGASPRIARSPVHEQHRLPSYRQVLTIRPGIRDMDVSFAPEFDRALEGMIVPSNNVSAAACVHGVGYGYLNGSLAAGGFFDPSTDRGLWVAGDFQAGTGWPYVRIASRNDGLVAQAGTTRHMAALVSLIMTDRVFDARTCEEMRGRLARAAIGIDTPWIARTSAFGPGVITHNKLGLGPLKSGPNVRSEVSVYRSPVRRDRRYVVAWQNQIGLVPIGFADIARILRTAIDEYERASVSAPRPGIPA